MLILEERLPFRSVKSIRESRQMVKKKRNRKPKKRKKH